MMTYAFEIKKSFKVTFFFQVTVCVAVCALSAQARYSKNQFLKNAPYLKIMTLCDYKLCH